MTTAFRCATLNQTIIEGSLLWEWHKGRCCCNSNARKRHFISEKKILCCHVCYDENARSFLDGELVLCAACLRQLLTEFEMVEERARL
jgi:hypothetical protein